MALGCLSLGYQHALAYLTTDVPSSPRVKNLNSKLLLNCGAVLASLNLGLYATLILHLYRKTFPFCRGGDFHVEIGQYCPISISCDGSGRWTSFVHLLRWVNRSVILIFRARVKQEGTSPSGQYIEKHPQVAKPVGAMKMGQPTQPTLTDLTNHSQQAIIFCSIMNVPLPSYCLRMARNFFS